MKDLVATFEKLDLLRADCDLISQLATDADKRRTYTALTQRLAEITADLQGEISRLRGR